MSDELSGEVGSLKRLMQGGTASYQRELLANEAKARKHRVFTMFLIPGMLQTRAYAAVRFAEAAKMLEVPADVEESVDARMERGRLIRSEDHKFHFIICEAALRAAMAPAGVMGEQLESLVGMLGLPNVLIGIVPSAVRHYPPLCEFWIRDDDVVETETYSAAVSVTDPGGIGMYVKAFDLFDLSAVYGHGARSLIVQAIGHIAGIG